jgi:hypothetical protein
MNIEVAQRSRMRRSVAIVDTDVHVSPASGEELKSYMAEP